MGPEPLQTETADPRVYFAAERTLLAWVRTGLSMMGFGFVVARFGLFLRTLAAVEGAPSTSQRGLSLWVGTTLVILGAAVNLGAAIIHSLTVERIQKGEPIRIRRVSLGTIVALVLVLLGLAVAAYLLFGLSSPS